MRAAELSRGARQVLKSWCERVAVHFCNLVLCCISAPAGGQFAVFLSVRSSFEDQRIFMTVAAGQCQVLGIFSPEGQFAVLCSVGFSIETQPILMIASAVRCYFLPVRGMAKSLSEGAHTDQAGTQRVQGQHGCPHRKTLRDVVVSSDGAGDLRVSQEQWTQWNAAFATLQCPLFREAKHLPPPSSEATQVASA